LVLSFLFCTFEEKFITMESLLFALDNRKDLAQSIIDEAKAWDLPLNTELGTLRNQKFSDGELCVDFTDSVRGKRVYLLTSPNTSDEIIKLTLAIDAAKRAGAKEIVPILPYYPYARQDKKDQSRGPIGAKVMASILQACGSTSVITYDLHADQIQGFFEIPVTHIEGKNVFNNYIAEICTPDTVLCGPDAGSGKRVKRMKEQLIKNHGINLNYIMLDKTRKQANVIDEMVIIGDVKGKDVIILDDMVDTAGTLCKAAEVLIEAGAKSVRAIISHGVLSGDAYYNISRSKLTELVISDSLSAKTFESGPAFKKIKVISVAEQIGFVITALNNDMSYESITATKIKHEEQ
jgi:ribose-phosphate pyrophosphokinase